MGLKPLDTFHHIGTDTFNSPLLAVVDIGSNSIHLEVGFRRAHRPLHVIHDRKIKCQLAAGLSGEAVLDNAAIERGLAALEEIKADLDQLAPDHVWVVATHTLRTAINRQDFLDRANEILGFPCEVINGTTEAEWVLLGAAVTEQVEGPLAILDIGGGSTEIALGEPLERRSTFSISLPVGCVTLRDEFSGITRRADFEQASRKVRSLLQQSAIAEGCLGGGKKVFATSGTAKALAKLVTGHCLVPDAELAGSVITQERLRKSSGLLLGKCDFKHQDYGIGVKRSALLGSGLAIMLEVMAYLEIEELTYSLSSLRDGVLYRA